MDISYYYQILDTGIQYEKGQKVGKHWKIGERIVKTGYAHQKHSWSIIYIIVM